MCEIGAQRSRRVSRVECIKFMLFVYLCEYVYCCVVVGVEFELRLFMAGEG